MGLRNMKLNRCHAHVQTYVELMDEVHAPDTAKAPPYNITLLP
jgi:hypothetical protein